MYSCGIKYTGALLAKYTNNTIYKHSSHFLRVRDKLIELLEALFIQTLKEHTVLKYLCKLIEICHFKNINICELNSAVSKHSLKLRNFSLWKLCVLKRNFNVNYRFSVYTENVTNLLLNKNAHLQ